MSRATPNRRLEFAAGRLAARDAMGQLGFAASPVPMASDRAPIWPEGLIGSITHSAGLALACVAQARDVAALGIDLEPDEALEKDLVSTILTPEEAEAIPEEDARAAFCAKEAVYKALYPLTGEIWDFDAVGLVLYLKAETFTARLRKDAGPFPRDTALRGIILREDGLILAGMAVPRR